MRFLVDAVMIDAGRWQNTARMQLGGNLPVKRAKTGYYARPFESLSPNQSNKAKSVADGTPRKGFNTMTSKAAQFGKQPANVIVH